MSKTKRTIHEGYQPPKPSGIQPDQQRGYQPKPNGNYGFQPINQSKTSPKRPTSGSIIITPEKTKESNK